MQPFKYIPEGEDGRENYVIQRLATLYANATGGIWSVTLDQITSTANTEWALFVLADENDKVDANAEFVVVSHTLMPELLKIAQREINVQDSIPVMTSYIEDLEEKIQKIADHFFTEEEQKGFLDEGGFYELADACVEKALSYPISPSI
jgi:hypothetical protein